MTSRRRKLLIDCDAGSDDAVALLMASARDDVDVVGITAINGNAPVDDVTRNVLQVLRFVNKPEIPVFRGSAVTLAGHATAANGFHGNDGMGDCLDPSLVNPDMVQSESAASAIVRIVNEHKGNVTLVATGPLTNVAVALHLDPQLGSKLKAFYAMGGTSRGVGNITAAAEFNFYADPEAARMVLEQIQIPVTLVPFEVCLDNSFTWEEYEQLIKLPHPNVAFVRETHEVYTVNARRIKLKNFPAFDELAMAVFLDPLVATEISSVHATVCTDTGICRGQMVIDWNGNFHNAPNVRLVTGVNRELYVSMMKEALTR